MQRSEDPKHEKARQRAEADVNSTAEVEGAAAAQHESERRENVQTAARTRAAQEAKSSAEGKNNSKDQPPTPSRRPGNFTGEDTNAMTTTPPPEAWQGEDTTAEHTEQIENTQERSDDIASEVRPNNKFRREQEREDEVEENINTDPAALEESGEISGPPGPSVSHANTDSP